MESWIVALAGVKLIKNNSATRIYKINSNRDALEWSGKLRLQQILFKDILKATYSEPHFAIHYLKNNNPRVLNLSATTQDDYLLWFNIFKIFIFDFSQLAIPSSPDSQTLFVVQGSRLLKIPFKSSSKIKDSFVNIELLPLQIVYTSKNTKKTVLFDDFKEIRRGIATKSFELHSKNVNADCCFSVLYYKDGKYKTLDFSILL